MLWRNEEDFKSTLSTLKGLTSSQVHSTLVTSNCQDNKNSTTTHTSNYQGFWHMNIHSQVTEWWAQPFYSRFHSVSMLDPMCFYLLAVKTETNID